MEELVCKRSGSADLVASDFIAARSLHRRFLPGAYCASAIVATFFLGFFGYSIIPLAVFQELVVLPRLRFYRNSWKNERRLMEL